MSGLRLLAVHAHPDDEASKGAATMAMYAEAGHDVRVITMTGGERGDILNPALDADEILQNLTQVRREEMARAVEILGISHSWAGFEDSGLPEGYLDPNFPEDKKLSILPPGCFARIPLDEAVERLVKEIRQFKPHVIITYDENGGYPHPDHIRTHDATMRAWELAGQPEAFPHTGAAWEPLKLYYEHTFFRSRIAALHEAIADEHGKSPFNYFLDKWPEDAPDRFDRVTTRVSSGAYFDKREAALLAHATQVDPNGFFVAVSTSIQQQIWPTEEFELAASRVETQLPETDLFAGINSY